MKVLVATKETQGQRENDFSHAEESEFVTFQFECDGGSVDDDCGCHRSLTGMTSGKPTTTFKVEERDVSAEDMTNAVLASLKRGRWVQDTPTTEDIEWAETDAEEILRIASLFPVGAVVEKRGDRFGQRAVTA